MKFKQLMVEDMIKSLKCIASQDADGDCYMEHENFKHMEDDNYKPIVCGAGENLRDPISGEDTISCPYYNKTFKQCLDEGDLSWMKNVAELLEKQIPKIINMDDEIKYLDGQSVGWVCPTCNVIIFDFGIYDYCPHCGQKLEWRDDNIEAESN